MGTFLGGTSKSSSKDAILASLMPRPNHWLRTRQQTKANHICVERCNLQQKATTIMAKQAELRDLQKTARDFYEAKKYGEALNNLSKAVTLAQKWSPSDVSSILDQRVAVHVKLGKIGLARKDAMGMIRTNKADARGYLRCGQLDRLEDNPSAALRWYEHGLKHVSPTDPLRSTLGTQRSKTKVLLEQKLVASNARDPVSTLPAELVQQIAMYIDYIEIVKVLRVSKAWNDTISRLKPLTDSVDFTDAKCEINYKMMVAVLKRLGTNPKRLIMKNLAEPAENLLQINLARWYNYTQLEELTITPRILRGKELPFSKYNLKRLELKAELGPPGEGMIAHILNQCRVLEVARFSNLGGQLGYSNRGIPKLLPHATVRTLHLVGAPSPGRTGMAAYSTTVGSSVFASFPRLEELECRNLEIICGEFEFDLSGLLSLRKLLFSSCCIDRWPKLPPSIEVWDNYAIKTMENTFFLESTDASSIGTLGKLKFLRFNKTSPPPPMFSFMPTRSTASLTSLDVRSTSANFLFGTGFLYDFLEHLKNLRELAWGDNQGDRNLDSLVRFENLEMVSLVASPIHGADLIELLMRPTNRLKQITLTDCENVSSDTIEWARSRGVTMHVKKSLAAFGSERRVRGH